MNTSLIHDIAFVTTREIMKMLLIDDENYRVMWAQVYETIRAGLECYDVKAERRMSRLEPGRN